MKTVYIRASAVRALAKENGKRVSPEFLAAMDRAVRAKIIAACSVHNGGYKTLTPFLATHVMAGGNHTTPAHLHD